MPPSTHQSRLWRLQFSLATLFILMTLSAIGTWYWYQLPFEIENKVADPFGSTAASRRDVETVRRLWGGKTLRHGPRRVYDNKNNLLSLENYRTGEKHGHFITYTSQSAKLSEQSFVHGKLHGPSFRWNSNGTLTTEENYANGVRHGKHVNRHPDGSMAFEAAYQQDVPEGKWSWFPGARTSVGKPRYGTIVGQWQNARPYGHWEWRDAGNHVYLAADFQDGHITASPELVVHPQALEGVVYAAGENPRLMLFLFRPIELEFANLPLKDAMLQYIKTANVPMRIDLRGLEAAGISSNVSISSQTAEAPLLVGMSQMLRPCGLDCDFRYGMLCIDAARSLAEWEDATAISQVFPPPGSQLADQWRRTTNVDVVEMPFKDVILYLQDIHAVRFDISLLPTVQKPNTSVATADSPITASLRGISFKDALATILDQIHCQASLRGEVIVIEPQ